jgi:aromatic ring-opening dioxygenase catalytic subunit (LigB family)
MPHILPVIFFGHGNPMNAVQHNAIRWRTIGKQPRKPRAVLSISAHWFVPETGITVSTAPRTIHDFGGAAGALSGAISGSGRSRSGPPGAGTISANAGATR